MTDDDQRTVDPDGRVVVLDWRTREHLRRRRPKMLDDVDAILGTVRAPEHRDLDPTEPGRERFYRQNVLTPGRWLRVVVDFNEQPGWIVTVLVQHNDPRSKP
jgi:hypothetical protein